jgi:hypothetical protein
MFVIHSRTGEGQKGELLAITGDDGKGGWDFNKAIQYYRKDGSLTINGNVGIGMSNPKEKLHVTGDIVLGNDVANQKFIIHSRTQDIGKGDFLSITSDNADGNWVWGREIKFYRDGTFTTRGNVGIGTDKPESKLTVNGKITCEELVVKDVPAADFVFDANYTLRSLNDLEYFINKNKHLPDIPSAREFKDKGSYSLSDFDTKILQKVEELTLYIIQLKKENEQLKLKVETLLNIE